MIIIYLRAYKCYKSVHDLTFWHHHSFAFLNLIFFNFLHRVAVQNERYEDWSNVLLQLRRLFTDYQKIVLQYHERPNMEIPTAINSTAAQGNFLEVLNMSLNGKYVDISDFSLCLCCFDSCNLLTLTVTATDLSVN